MKTGLFILAIFVGRMVSRGIGYTLLYHCLREMKERGYEYAVIGQAGPLEFYEIACDAIVIPKNEGLKTTPHL